MVDRRLHDDLLKIYLHLKAPRFDLHRSLVGSAGKDPQRRAAVANSESSVRVCEVRPSRAASAQRERERESIQTITESVWTNERFCDRFLMTL
jgi:hypothetical protein